MSFQTWRLPFNQLAKSNRILSRIHSTFEFSSLLSLLLVFAILPLGPRRRGIPTYFASSWNQQDAGIPTYFASSWNQQDAGIPSTKRNEKEERLGFEPPTLGAVGGEKSH